MNTILHEKHVKKKIFQAQIFGPIVRRIAARIMQELASPSDRIKILRHPVLNSYGAPIIIYLTLVGNLLLFSAAILFYWVEVGINPAVTTFFDAIWWAFSTVTTVGYGDVIPHTTLGRVIAIFLMVTGASFFFGFTAVLISLFSAMTMEEIIEEEKSTQHDFAILLEEVRGLRQSIQQSKLSIPPDA